MHLPAPPKRSQRACKAAAREAEAASASASAARAADGAAAMEGEEEEPAGASSAAAEAEAEAGEAAAAAASARDAFRAFAARCAPPTQVSPFSAAASGLLCDRNVRLTRLFRPLSPHPQPQIFGRGGRCMARD